jgi:hypothetical protein
MTDEIDPDAILAEALRIVEALSIAQVGDHGSMADLEAMAFNHRLGDPNLSFHRREGVRRAGRCLRGSHRRNEDRNGPWRRVRARRT